MDQINNIQVVPCTSSNHLKPFRVHYSQNGTKKSWDFMRTHESVSILIFNTTSHCFVLVKQFRPAVYVSGVTYELCAGLVDKPDLPLEEIARQGVLQECGYDVPVAKLRKITSYRSGVGVTGAKQTLFYAEVSEENHVGVGVAEGAAEPREGEVVKVPLHEAMTFAYDESIPKTMPVIFSFIWFHSNMSPKYKISTNV
ncbi:hypothetical protein AAFF_G00203540 [Aldrovandia affinis]|uniref:Uridine diphosphate glucose pyrophosphatase NUDT14 n=1 Tax=Aldrovandia affinis TaxID=143900 RepID=A0AAD7SXY7_9TELE|nr:hypothetical protein AAFF_G00203540 [Aldrovandia affinis]